MALQNPVEVYSASSNLEAQLLCDLLKEAGIEAFAEEDASSPGHWLGDVPPAGLQDSKVWVDQTVADQAAKFIEEYEKKEAALRSELTPAGAADTSQATCEKCGRKLLFPAAEQGTVQKCPYCNAYVDVGGGKDLGNEWAGEGEASPEGEEKA